MVSIYSDGSCISNPGGPGGWAAIIVSGNKETVLSGRSPSTTNNRMELMGAISALERCEPQPSVTLYTDSKYVILCGERGARWQMRRKAHANPDLVDRLLSAQARHAQVRWVWIQGHNGHKLNERCDRLAGKEAVLAIADRVRQDRATGRALSAR